AAIEAEDIRRAWPAVREAVRSRTRTVEVMLAGATVAAVNGRTIHLVHDYAPLAKRLSQPHNATVITDSITEVVGGQWVIECTSGTAPAAGTASAAPAAGPGTAAGSAGGPPTAPQQPEPRGWERRVQSRTDRQAAEGAGGTEDTPPPPEEPEPEPSEPPPPPVTEDEMVDEARSGPQNLDHRTGEDIALALLKEHLGARPIDR
ncbi:MAG TPA: DNA polymerase III subunit gamma/tau, partial [Candidatus Dietzia intestinigallinarum]|nr:DNA polymerase III subunit gamma/tau [Candidatus Dietzia intestinigallinarum]